MGVIQSAVNKVIAGASAGVVATPAAQQKIKEKDIAAKNKAKVESLESEAQKAAIVKEQSKVDISADSLAKRYPIGKNKATREEQSIQAATEVGKLEQSVKSQNDLTDKLEAVYKNNPTPENFKRYMNQKAEASAANVPAQKEIQNIRQRLNFIEPDSIEKRKLARQKLDRRIQAKRQDQEELLNFLNKNKNVRVDQLSAKQKKTVIDAINGGQR